MGTEPKSVLSTSSKVWLRRDGPLCQSKEQAGKDVLFSLSQERESEGLDALAQNWTFQLAYTFPPFGTDSASHSETQPGFRPCPPSGPMVAKKGLVCDLEGTFSSASLEDSRPSLAGSSAAPQTGILSSDSLVSERQILKSKGCSDRVIDTLSS